MDYGLDSIASTEIGTLFTQRFGISVPPTVFFEFQNLQSFCGYLLANHHGQLLEHYGDSAPLPAPHRLWLRRHRWRRWLRPWLPAQWPHPLRKAP